MKFSKDEKGRPTIDGKVVTAIMLWPHGGEAIVTDSDEVIALDFEECLFLMEDSYWRQHKLFLNQFLWGSPAI